MTARPMRRPRCSKPSRRSCPRCASSSMAATRDRAARVRTGVRAARADIVVTLDGDGQNDPADIPRLVADSAQQRRRRAHRPRAGRARARAKTTCKKRVASRLANRFRRWMLNDGATDAGCGLKAFRRDVFLALPYFDHMHRYHGGADAARRLRSPLRRSQSPSAPARQLRNTASSTARSSASRIFSACAGCRSVFAAAIDPREL